ncbi:MAG: para-aminobenzoate synthetase [Bacillariaceae sp.]|jgi:para-aminobenzoate synthetase
MLAQLTIEPPIVVAKDAIDSASLFDDENNSGSSSFFDQFDGIVLSPGPGTPQEQPPLSHLAISKNPDVPILGVCLGHQLMSLAYGGSVDRAPVPIHGQDHRIVQQGLVLASPCHPSLFRDLPSSFRVVRYHSLCAYDLPEDLTVTAKSLDDVVQGIQHVTNPHYGVQFHPESIGTENGMALLENFVRVVQQRKDAQQQLGEKKQYSRHIGPNYGFEKIGQSKSNSVRNVDNSVVDVNESTNIHIQNRGDQLSQGNHTMSDSSSSASMVSSSDNTQSSSRFRVMVHKLSSSPSTSSPLQVFENYYAHKSHTIWLDSSSYPSRGELDIMSTSSRPEDIIEYHLDDNDIDNDTDILSRLENELFGEGKNSMNSYASDIGWVKLNARNNDDNDKEEEDHVLEWVQENDEQGATRDNTTENLPFHYRGGFLGFLGYEVRHDTQRYLKRLERGVFTSDSTEDIMVERNSPNNGNGHNEGEKRVPTAAFFLARQSMVYHHPSDSWFLIGLVEDHTDIQKNIEWMKTVDADLMNIAKSNELSLKNETLPFNYSPNSPRSSIEFIPNRPKSTYENDIAKCHEYIKKGDSYELCLTNKLEAYIDANVSTFDLYRIIRKVNPAPYSAYLRWNLQSDYIGNQNKLYDVPSSTSLVICSSSPERFMSVSRQQPHPEIPSYLQAEAKPIKGTCARVIAQNGICLSDAEIREDDRRARSLELSLKNRAENLMIVDLLRNDMSRVCKTGTVHVSKLMDIESFATVHQMVSTIRGTLSDSNNSIGLLRASFPGGSMTGAPKIRTMEILEELEQNVDRGPYAGSIGYLSVNGCMDMNIMIRSAAVTPSEKKEGEWKVSIGAGGAITALSDAEDEYDEMLLKARAVLESVEKWVSIIDDDKMKVDTHRFCSIEKRI